MQLTQYTDYSLRVLIYLGLHPGERATINDISNVYEISRNHLVKVVHQLSQNGWITTYRGKNGGMCLTFSPEQINIGAVVRQTEPHMHLLECFDKPNDKCTISSACTLKHVLFQARKAFMDVLDQHTLADAIGSHSSRILQLFEEKKLAIPIQHVNTPRSKSEAQAAS